MMIASSVFNKISNKSDKTTNTRTMTTRRKVGKPQDNPHGSPGTPKNGKRQDFKNHYNLPDTSNDLPEELKRDTDLSKVYNETNAFSKNVCFTCGSNDHHRRHSQESTACTEIGSRHVEPF